MEEGKEPIAEILETGDGLKFVFLRRMDVQASAEFEPLLKSKLPEAIGRKRIVFDLGKVDFIGSSFLRLCVMAAKETKGNFAVVGFSPAIHRTLVVAGFENFAKTF